MKRVNDEFLELIKPLELKHPVTQITELTGFSKSYVSRVYRNEVEASENFLRVLREKIDKQKQQKQQPQIYMPDSYKPVYAAEPGVKYANKQKDAITDPGSGSGAGFGSGSGIGAGSGSGSGSGSGTGSGSGSDSNDTFLHIVDMLQGSTSTMNVHDDSMSPEFPPGCVVGLIPVTIDVIQPGRVYVVVTSGQRIIRRIFYKDDNSTTGVITCYADNISKFVDGPRQGLLKYPPFNIDKNAITELYLVTGVVNRLINATIESLNHTK